MFLPNYIYDEHIIRVMQNTHLKGENYMITNQLVINATVSKPLLLYGVKDVLPAWTTYYKELDNTHILEDSSNYSEESTKYAENWRTSNSFLVSINIDTHEICAIRDFGMYHPDVTDYLFRTNLLPIYTHQPESNEEALVSVAESTLQLFNDEITKMKLAGDYPVFLMEHCFEPNDYIAWSITENKPIIIYGYKSYLNGFSYSDIDAEDIIENDKYTIIPPSAELISALGLKLHPYHWENKLSFDKWVGRTPKEDLSHLIPTIYVDTYKKSINAINLSRANNLGYDKEFASLESRTARFERLCQLGAPAEIMFKEVELIEKAYKPIAHLIV